ncbi:molybdate ABC transporter substrate-binding protein [Myxosarcina sp. GI1]|uniref:molybdate ABC transporter substrate-binding protein n=1 Tax=Myxosarcina sp. GI1 TaxID=1541065 RepID=UPI00056C4B1A|nr:molybdate ABC transporter substrate-binding protein [Myxosarcina sp. GI1]
MKTKDKLKNFSISTLVCFLTIGCNNLSNIKLERPSQAEATNQLTISAASSLKDVMEKIEPLYQQLHPKTDITYNFGSSGSLQRQIEQGAPVDVFISAASKQMDALAKEDLLLIETRRNLLKNQIVLVTPKNVSKANLKVDNFNDLTDENIQAIALGEPESVPAGEYAQEVLTSFKIADKVEAKAVYGKDVHQVVSYVTTGNVDAGIVYRTDVRAADNVRIVATAPENSHSPVVYPIAVIKDSQHPEEAKDLIEFLTTPEAKEVFKENGFVTINNEQ